MNERLKEKRRATSLRGRPGAADGAKAAGSIPLTFDSIVSQHRDLVNVTQAMVQVHAGVDAAIWLDEQKGYRLEPTTRAVLQYVRDVLADAGLSADRGA